MKLLPFFLPLLAALPVPLLAQEPPPAPAAEILTPPAPAAPRVNGPGLFGVRPGSPFLYTIPATGVRPLEFSVEGLPEGLQVDSATGRITGKLLAPGETTVTLRARNQHGTAEKKFRIVVGENIALTPPMGWSSWNCWGGAVSQENVLRCARAMVEKGLQDHGWTYLNIDDGWQGLRGGEFHAIQPNSKFPDLKALSEEIHRLGLKLGLYSSPWRGTYEGHIGGSADRPDGTYAWVEAGDHNEFYRFGKDPAAQSRVKQQNWVMGAHSFAAQDAAQWAQWEVDYLKYDWFPVDIPHTREMSAALRHSSRDIVFSLSNSGVYDNAADYARLAQVWRTTGDIRDTWQSVTHLGFTQDRWAGFTGPGHWSDPDMLVVGQVGGWAGKLRPTRLTPDEQYAHFSLWCLLSAPLLLGCDLAQLDDFTLGLLTNDEVLAINQDAAGRQATQISHEEGRIVYAKTLADGSVAVGLFNLGSAEATVGVGGDTWKLAPVSATGELRVRDLWRQRDLGLFTGRFESKVPPHGVVLLRLSAP